MSAATVSRMETLNKRSSIHLRSCLVQRAPTRVSSRFRDQSRLHKATVRHPGGRLRWESIRRFARSGHAHRLHRRAHSGHGHRSCYSIVFPCSGRQLSSPKRVNLTGFQRDVYLQRWLSPHAIQKLALVPLPCCLKPDLTPTGALVPSLSSDMATVDYRQRSASSRDVKISRPTDSKNENFRGAAELLS